ncbi:MAG: CocE/NonD family hydrolase [Sphingomonas sp.]
MRGLLLLLGMALSLGVAPARAESPFVAESAMVPMRDGVKLHTVILRPRDQKGPLPILLERSPYGIDEDAPETMPDDWQALAKDGYIFVFQSMRGRFKSEGGPFTLSTEIKGGRKAVDESTDAWDSVAWLVKNVKPSNGRVGMWGVSYPGLAAAIALARPAPRAQGGQPAGGLDRLFHERRPAPLRRDAADLCRRLALDPAMAQGRQRSLPRPRGSTLMPSS